MACLLPVKRECCQASTRDVKWKGSSWPAEFLPSLQVAHSRGGLGRALSLSRNAALLGEDSFA